MRIATLQFAPQLGNVEANIRRADQLLKLTPGDISDGPGIEELRPDILVLPEMAFSGRRYNAICRLDCFTLMPFFQDIISHL